VIKILDHEGKRMSGKVAIITGAGKGIGRGVARVFASEGATVVIADLDEQAGIWPMPVAPLTSCRPT